MTTKLISERLSPVEFTAGADCAEPGVVKGVCICGLSSANGRDYPSDVLRKAAKLYEGSQVYLDHLDERGRSRGVREWFGEIRNVRSRPDGRPEGDLYFPAEHHFAAEFVSRANNFKRSLGLSHVVEAKTARRDGREVVEEISTVQSVDLVASPATNTSLTESRRAAVPQVKFRALVESVLPKLAPERAKPLRKWLVVAEDDMGMAPVMDAPVDEPAEGTDPDQAISDAFKQAMHAQIDALIDGSHTLAELISKIRELGKAHGKLTGKSADTGGSEGGDEGGESQSDDKSESKQLDSAALLLECKALAFDPTFAQGEQLRRIADADTRKSVVEAWKAAAQAKAPEHPRAAGRQAVKEDRQPVPVPVGGPDIDEIKKRMKG